MINFKLQTHLLLLLAFGNVFAQLPGTAVSQGAPSVPSLTAVGDVARTTDGISAVVGHRKTTDGDVLLTAVLEIPEGTKVYSSSTQFFSFSVDHLSGLELISENIPPAVTATDLDGSRIKVFKNKVIFEKRYTVTEQDWQISGSLRFQACAGNTCFPPRTIRFSAVSGSEQLQDDDAAQTRGAGDIASGAGFYLQAEGFSVVNRSFGFSSPRDFSEFLAAGLVSTARDSVSRLASLPLLVLVLVILLGGLALNLTPCVLPMIPVNLAVIGAGSLAGSKKQGFLLCGIYGLAIALAYGVLGLAVVLFGATFGSLNASPWFNLGVALLFALMTIAMLDIIPIDLTRFRRAGTVGGKASLLTVFSLGTVSALLAGACVAPVVISVLLYSASLYSDGQVAGLLLPFLLGLGMALPWPFAGAGLSFLPKPGRWMTRVKWVFAALIFVLALYYGKTGISLFRNQRAVSSVEQVELKPQNTSSGLDFKLLASEMQRAHAENQHVVLDFWATWCKNCLAMEKSTLRNEQVQRELAAYRFIKVQAEDPADPAVKKLMEYYGVWGLPAYVLLRPRTK
jgi:thiol:disulfide interchange protein